jgi:hypothetical protein
MSESIDHSWICREDFGIERNQSFKGDHGNAQFSLCCTSTAMPDDDSQDRHPAFCCTETSNQAATGAKQRPGFQSRKPVEAAMSAANINSLFLNSRDVSCHKLPTAIALDQCVRELHDSIKRFAVRCAFYARFSENNCRVIAVKPS